MQEAGGKVSDPSTGRPASKLDMLSLLGRIHIQAQPFLKIGTSNDSMTPSSHQIIISDHSK